MTAEARKVVTLIAEIAAERAALDDQHRRVCAALDQPTWAPEDPTLSVVAVALHHYYGAAESIFERVARCFEGAPDPGSRWHQDLLERMALDLTGIRPALVSPGTRVALRELLGFRHFFRDAYAVTLDAGRLRERAEALGPLHRALCAELDGFEGTLRAAVGDDGDRGA